MYYYSYIIRFGPILISQFSAWKWSNFQDAGNVRGMVFSGSGHWYVESDWQWFYETKWCFS